MNILTNPLRKHRRHGPQTRTILTHYGLKLSLPVEAGEDELLRQLATIPSETYRLPKEQGLALDFGERRCSRKLILHLLQSVVWEKDIRIVAWLSTDPESIKLLASAGLPTSEPVPPEQQVPPSNGDIQGQPPIVPPSLGGKQGGIATQQQEDLGARSYPPHLKAVYTSMRSGQSIKTDGDVLVWGHLNPGAEIEAGGSVLIAGRLLGLVHAGAGGRHDVFVWAGSFEAPQVRIADKLCYADAMTTACWRKGVLITLEDDTPVIREYKFFTGGSKS